MPELQLFADTIHGPSRIATWNEKRPEAWRTLTSSTTGAEGDGRGLVARDSDVLYVLMLGNLLEQTIKILQKHKWIPLHFLVYEWLTVAAFNLLAPEF
jgi:hypothetical protein